MVALYGRTKAGRSQKAIDGLKPRTVTVETAARQQLALRERAKGFALMPENLRPKLLPRVRFLEAICHRPVRCSPWTQLLRDVLTSSQQRACAERRVSKNSGSSKNV